MKASHIIIGIISSALVLWYGHTAKVRHYGEFINDISVELKIDNHKTTHELMIYFCKKIYESDRTRHNDSEFLFYDAKQSYLMTLLCEKDEEKNKKYLQHQDRRSYGLECSPSFQGWNDCTKWIDKTIHIMYNNIANDLFNQMTAQAYGHQEPPEKQKLTSQEKAYIFLHKEENRKELCPSQEKCIIPETHERLAEYIKTANDLTKQHKRINIEKPQANAPCDEKSKTQWTYRIRECGTGLTADMHMINNIIRNELLRYTVFTTYYANQLEHNTKLQPNKDMSNLKTIRREWLQQAQYVQTQAKKVHKTTNKATLNIAQIKSTFKTHIHLLAYYEITKTIRNELSKIYTPIHQLYFKLRNVQTQG